MEHPRIDLNQRRSRSSGIRLQCERSPFLLRAVRALQQNQRTPTVRERKAARCLNYGSQEDEL